LSRDPVESEHPYLYVRGNPVNRIDPTGQCWWLSGEDYAQCVTGIAEAVWWYEENVNQPMNDFAALALGVSSLPDDPTVFQAIVSSHSQETDGFIIGGSVAANFIALLGVSDPIVGYLNGTCVPGTGRTFGVEVVYDFKHQERGLFRYHGGVLNFLGVGNAGGTGYMGLTRGFATQSSPRDPTGYRFGVGAYGGPFAVTDVGFTPLKTPVTIGGVFIEAAPLDTDTRNLNPNGVFATYIGLNAGGGLSIPFVSGDIAVTNYTLLFNGNWPGRVRYALPFGTGGLSDDQIIERQRSIPRRMAAAAAMTNEINIIGGSAANPVTSFAIGKLWSWALRP
jgi:hypothetical protein